MPQSEPKHRTESAALTFLCYSYRSWWSRKPRHINKYRPKIPLKVRNNINRKIYALIAKWLGNRQPVRQNLISIQGQRQLKSTPSSKSQAMGWNSLWGQAITMAPICTQVWCHKGLLLSLGIEFCTHSKK